MTNPIPYKITNLEVVAGAVELKQPLMYDCETIGLYGKIRLVQFFQRGWDHVLMVENPDPMTLVSILSKAHVVCHNTHYDVSCIQQNLGRMSWMPEEFDCTFLLSRLHYYKEESFSLDQAIKYALGFNPYAGTVTDQQGSNWNVPVLSEEQLVYAAADAYYMHDLYDVVKEQKDNINYQLDILSTRYCLDFQNNGLPYEEDKIQARYKENMAKIKEIGLPINCNSYQQVRKYINSNLSDDSGLAILIHQGNEKAKAVRETRKLTKNNSFLTKFLNEGANDCIYGKFKISARSGRSTSDDQNLQQLPRNTKGVFGVEEGGDTVILFADYPQIQLRGVCVVAGDKKMEALFRAGEDLHNYVAKMIFGPDFTKTQRQICKTANFGLLFGAGVGTFRAILLKEAGLWLSEEEASKIKKLWLSLWKQVAAWQTSGIKAWKKGEAWETPLGRRYTAKMMTDQLAMQIQGFEAEVAKLAMHYMMPKLNKLDNSIIMRNFVHDSYILTCDNQEEIYKPASIIIGEAMKEAWSEMCQNVLIPDLPMPCNVRIGWNWGDIEKDKVIHQITV